MIREAQSEAKLRALLAGGSLSASDCGQAFLKLVAPLLAGSVLVAGSLCPFRPRVAVTV